MKKFLLLLVVFAATVQVFAQSTTNGQITTARIADIAGTTCTGPSGKPCPEWLHKLIGQYPPAKESTDNFTWQEVTGKEAGFWTYRGSSKYPPLRSNKQTLTSPTFLALNGTYAATCLIAGSRVSGEQGDRFAIPAIIGLDYVMDRFLSRATGVPTPVYGIFHYTKALVKNK